MQVVPPTPLPLQFCDLEFDITFFMKCALAPGLTCDLDNSSMTCIESVHSMLHFHFIFSFEVTNLEHVTIFVVCILSNYIRIMRVTLLTRRLVLQLWCVLKGAYRSSTTSDFSLAFVVENFEKSLRGARELSPLYY